jgi:hypothetical protein
MGADSERRDWNIPSQRPETAYSLWRSGRGVQTQFDETRRDFVLLLRDTNDQFHARWIRDESFDQVPERLRALMLSKPIGVMLCPP